MAGVRRYSLSGLFLDLWGVIRFSGPPSHPALSHPATFRRTREGRQRNPRLRQFPMKFDLLRISYHHFDIKQANCLVACTAVLQRTSAAREQISLQCLGVSSVAGEHLVKDVGNLRVVLLKSVHCWSQRASSSVGTGTR